MKKIIVFCVAFLATMSLCASDTSVKNANGVEIWYDFDNESKTASVTYKGSYSSEDFNEYTGEVVIPSTVMYKGEEYNVTEIGYAAFQGCSSLTSVTLPEGVTEIGFCAFAYCTSLTSITLPESVTSIGEHAFQGCRDLTSITLPESVTSIGRYAFEGCRDLTSITLPESVTSIGEYAFYDCSSLTSITIPESVTEIGDKAFNYCTSLTSITCKNTTPPILIESLYYEGENFTFEYVDKSIPLYVPAESVEVYNNTKYWKEFTNIQAIPSSSVINVKAETQDSVRKEYRDGQVLIINGDKTYTMFGTEY